MYKLTLGGSFSLELFVIIFLSRSEKQAFSWRLRTEEERMESNTKQNMDP